MSKYTNRVISEIVDTELVEPGQCIIVGFSGGPDSLCLLHALRQLSDTMNFDIVPVHVNHKLRENADAEQDKAVRMCGKMGLECLVFEADCKGLAEDAGISTEEAGRTIRYEIFDDVAEQLLADGVPDENIRIAVAHNADDQSETVLFRLMRGTGLHGLAGISPLRLSEADNAIIRPLLGITREEIEGYIEENKLHPNMDETNESPDYTRNKIRLELIPYIEKNYNPNIKEGLRRFAQLANADDTFLNSLAIESADDILEVDEELNETYIKIDEALELAEPVLRRIIGMVLMYSGLGDNVSYEIIQNILRVMVSNNPSAKINLPGGLMARREYGRLLFELAPDDEDETGEEDVRRVTLMPQIMMRKVFDLEKRDTYAAFDFDKFNKVYPGAVGEIQLRSRQEGDYIAMAEGLHKKIQDYMVDSKIKQVDRDKIGLVAIGNEVLWIIPDNRLPSGKQREFGRFSQNYQIDESTSRVLFLELVETV